MDIFKIYSISVQYYHSDLTAQVRLMNGKVTRFHFSDKLRKQFELEMNDAIKKINKEPSKK